MRGEKREDHHKATLHLMTASVHLPLDGSGLTRLIPISTKQFSFLNYDSQELWSNVSRDKSMYVLQVNSFRDTPTAIIETDSLIVGSLHGNGRAPKVFASTSDGSQLMMAGWTVM